VSGGLERRRDSRPRTGTGSSPLLAFAAAGIALLAAVLLPARAVAQGVVGSATTSLRWVDLEPITQDTVSLERVDVAADGSLTFEGRPVSCLPGLGCTFYRSLPEEGALDAAEDVALTAWGLGVQGFSVTALLRARVRFAGELVWPRSDDPLDLMLGYAELLRSELRVRAGRQETYSGLGIQGYDGVEVLWAPTPRLVGEWYVGRSLVRGLFEPSQDALAGLEDFFPERDAYLIGGSLTADLEAESGVGVRYQREIWSDRSGLLQERVSLDARTGRLEPLRVDGSIDWDAALGQLGKSHLTVGYPFAGRGLAVEGTVRRYIPYFALSTIWGFFSPVPYHEALLSARLQSSPALTSRLVAGWRRYGDTHKQDFLAPLTDEGWHVEASLATSPSAIWSAEGRARVEWGVGAFLSSLDAEARWRPRDGWELGVLFTSFQQILEFRVGDGRVWGGGLSWGADLPWRARLDGGAALYRHGPQGRGAESAWTQSRVWSALSVPFGSDPATVPRRVLRR
jgi:hypothetical protein